MYRKLVVLVVLAAVFLAACGGRTPVTPPGATVGPAQLTAIASRQVTATPTPDLEATADAAEAARTSTPTTEPTSTSTPMPTPTSTPRFADVDWVFEPSVEWCLANELCEAETDTTFGSDTIYRLDQVAALIQEVLYPNEELADFDGKFRYLKQSDILTEEDVRRIEFLYRKGRLKPCQPETDTRKPELCGERTQRLYVAEAFVVAGGWQISEEVEEPVCTDVWSVHFFAPTYKVFLEQGFEISGTMPPNVCLPWEDTTKQMVYMWLYHFHKLGEKGQVPSWPQNE